MVKKLAIVTTHPIQYNAPWFRLLAQHPDINLKVFYTWSQTHQGAKYDPGFGKLIEWDIPLLEGYDHEFIINVSKDPGSHHFMGIDNPTLNERIKEWEPGAILIIGWSYKSHLLCMRYFKGKVPMLFRGDSTLLDEKPGIKKLIRRIFLRYVYSFVDHALYVGTNNKNYFLKNGLKQEQLHYVPHAIDNDRFANNDAGYEQNAKKWRNDLGITDDLVVVLFAGKLEPKKQPDFILKLAENIPSEKMRFILVGNGPLESNLRIRAAQDKRIIFLGFQNQSIMPVVYRLCDLFILPSEGPGETWGLAINEAMACERPIIASTKVGCAKDLIKPGINGFIINGKVDTIISCLQEIIAYKELAKRMGSASKEIIKAFSFEVIVREIGSLLRKL